MKRNQKTQDMLVKKEKFQRVQFTPLLPMNQKQTDLLEALKYSTLINASGSAGTGKTLLSVWHAAKRLHYNDINKVVLIRAYQPLAGRSIGFIPGDQESKLLPYYQQLIDYFEDYLGKATVEIHIKNKTIEICSLETIRGRSWNNCIIIVDEAQNLYIPEVQALVTRIGNNAQMIFCGDNSGIQSDVKNTMDGLTYLDKLTEKYYISDYTKVQFTASDIVRSGITKEFVIAFESEQLADQLGNSIVSQVDQNKQHKKLR